MKKYWIFFACLSDFVKKIILINMRVFLQLFVISKLLANDFYLP